jgi:hypothetical protein
MARRKTGERLAIPRRLRLRGKTWTVRLARRVPAGDDGSPGPNRGLCDRTTCTIWIDRALPDPKRGETFIHEVLHALIGNDVEDEAQESAALALEGPLHELLLSGALVAVPEEVP